MAEFDDNKNGTLSYNEFLMLMDSIRSRKELQDIFNQYKNKTSQKIHVVEL